MSMAVVDIIGCLDGLGMYIRYNHTRKAARRGT